MPTNRKGKCCWVIAILNAADVNHIEVTFFETFNNDFLGYASDIYDSISNITPLQQLSPYVVLTVILSFD